MDPIIVIGRQYGGGGRKIGRELARRFDVPYYDKELLAEAAERMGMPHELLRQADERRPSALRSLLSLSLGVSDTYGLPPLGREALYEAQSRVIRQIASEGGCVIVGRTADYVLRDHPSMVSLFLHAPEEVRIERVMGRGECTEPRVAKERLRQADRQREDYYNYFTGRNWGHARNYHLTLDSSLLSEEETVDLLEAFIRSRVGAR